MIALVADGHFDSLAPERNVISEHMFRIKFIDTSCKIVLRWMLPNSFDDDTSLLVPVIAWWLQAMAIIWANIANIEAAQMAYNLHTTIANALDNFYTLMQITLKYVAKGPVSIRSVLAHAVTRHWTSEKSLTKSMFLSEFSFLKIIQVFPKDPTDEQSISPQIMAWCATDIRSLSKPVKHGLLADHLKLVSNWLIKVLVNIKSYRSYAGTI